MSPPKSTKNMREILERTRTSGQKPVRADHSLSLSDRLTHTSVSDTLLFSLRRDSTNINLVNLLYVRTCLFFLDSRREDLRNQEGRTAGFTPNLIFVELRKSKSSIRCGRTPLSTISKRQDFCTSLSVSWLRRSLPPSPEKAHYF